MLRFITYNPAVFAKYANRFLLVVAFIALYTNHSSAQTIDSVMTSADSVFTMKVFRDKSEVKINLAFLNAYKFKYVLIERKAEFDQNFSQIKYITYQQIMQNKNHELKTEDTYSFSSTTDVLYRLKLITMEDAVLIYPPVSLPGTNR